MFFRHTALSLLVILTTLYLALIFLGGGIPHNFPADFIGVFVPAGFWNSYFSYGVAPILTLVGAIYVDKFFEKKSFSQIKRISLTLVCLFVTTLVFDFVMWQHWNSMHYLLEPFGINFPYSGMGI